MWLYVAIISTLALVVTVLLSANSIGDTKCPFCQIVNHDTDTIIMYEDKDLCVFRSINRKCELFHVLIIPRRHIHDVKSLTAGDLPLVQKMSSLGKRLLSENNMSVADARLGFHWPPFRSVCHLHLHVIAPVSKMNWLHSLLFLTPSYWFTTVDDVIKQLQMLENQKYIKLLHLMYSSIFITSITVLCLIL